MAAKPPTPRLRGRYVTDQDKKIANWHQKLEGLMFYAALGLMAVSVVAIHWAMTNLLGLTGWMQILAWGAPIIMEAGMAGIASANTTTPVHEVARNLLVNADRLGVPMTPQQAARQARRIRVILWSMFSALMALAQAANIGHAIAFVASGASDIPEVIPAKAVYIFAAAFAALFPLGGTMFIYVSGFLRENGRGNSFIRENSELVYEEAVGDAHQPAARTPKAPPARTPVPQPARTEPTTRAQETPPVATPSARPVAGSGDSYWSNPTREQAYQAYKAARDGGKELDGKDLGELLGVHEGNARNQRNRKFRPRYEAELHVADPKVTDPIVAQVEADEARAEKDQAARAGDPAA